MPLITCEMRWFLEGPLPEEVERWFASGTKAAAAPWREDRYLVLPEVADMGIKQREGRLEIKGRTAKLGSHAVAPEVEGRAERWCKWSYDAAATAEGLRGALAGRQTIVVAKHRLQRHFLLEPGGPARPGARRDLARRGFSLELTRIRLPPGEDHWSLGVEAAPDDGGLLADLLRALGAVLQGFPLPLPRRCSMSYPAWLAQRAPERSPRRAD